MKATIGLNLELTRLPRRPEIGEYDWFDIEYSGTQVGKSRCRIESDRLTIFSIMIYPEFERRGFAREVINYFQKEYDLIVADRVRPTAREFWIKLGFRAEGENDFVWRRRAIDPASVSKR
jgi:ribosomal protein S18 acetylase RimI-like enzyme